MSNIERALFTLAQAEGSGTPVPESTTLWSYIASGGLLSWVLIALSFVALALVIRNLMTLRLARLAPPPVVHRLETLLRENNTEGALAFCNDPANDSFLTRVFGSALGRCVRSPFGFLELRTAMEEAGQTEVDRLHRLNDGIGIIAAVGPMLGLLGTVIGMIGAFDSIGRLEGASRSQELARFMAMALVNTAEGLVVAIPCTVAFALFRRHIDRITEQVGRVIEELAAHIEHAAGGERPAGPRPVRPGTPPVPRAISEGVRGANVP